MFASANSVSLTDVFSLARLIGFPVQFLNLRPKNSYPSLSTVRSSSLIKANSVDFVSFIGLLWQKHL